MHQLFIAHEGTLHRIAERVFARERRGHAMNPVDLVNEAFVQLVDQHRATAKTSSFFKACFARQCRRILVDHARRQRAQRRGGDRQKDEASVSNLSGIGGREGLDLVEIDDLLNGLEKVNPRLARIAEMRIFTGSTVAECADGLECSTSTIEKEWRLASGWLGKELGAR
ncbi:MAG: sigma-70 family RNA polymerase sigma factor [Planctomycetes bacterium]|nr:sigma-70 family RNA polymerase sigma factor [Planctomycetota bacterium]